MGAIDVDGNGSGYVSGGVTAAPGGLFPEYTPSGMGFQVRVRPVLICIRPIITL